MKMRRRAQMRKNRLPSRQAAEFGGPRKKRRLNQKSKGFGAIGNISTKELRKNRNRRRQPRYNYVPDLEDEDDTVFIKPEPQDDDYSQFSKNRQKLIASQRQKRMANVFED